MCTTILRCITIVQHLYSLFALFAKKNDRFEFGLLKELAVTGAG